MSNLFLKYLQRKTALSLGAIVFLGAVLRFRQIAGKTIWLDEAFSIWIAAQGLWRGWVWLVRIDQHPPLYYTLLHFWQMLFGDGQASVRSLSALCGTLAIPFFFAAARRMTRDNVAALLAALLLALAPFHVHFGQETRMYALLTLTAAGALHFAARYLDGDGSRRLVWRDWVFPRRWMRLGDVRAAVGLALCLAATMLTHNTAAVFFFLALNIPVVALSLYQRRTGRHVDLRALNAQRFQRNWLRIQGVALLLWSVWLVPFLIQSFGVDRAFWLGAPTVETVVGALRNFSFAHLPDGVLAVPGLLLYLALTLLGVYFLRYRPGRLLLLLSLFLLPILGELLVSLRRPIFYDRTLIWTTLPYYLLVACGAARPAGRSRLRSLRPAGTGARGNARSAPARDRAPVRGRACASLHRTACRHLFEGLLQRFSEGGMGRCSCLCCRTRAARRRHHI